MAKTTVNLTDIAQQIKNEFVHLGLGNILSAGLVLFSKQSAEDKLKAMAEARGIATNKASVAPESKKPEKKQKKAKK